MSSGRGNDTKWRWLYLLSYTNNSANEGTANKGKTNNDCSITFLAWSSSVQKKTKMVFASYSSRLRTRHAQYDFWAIIIMCILAVVGCLHATWKKRSSTQCNENDNFDQFVRFIACFVVLTQNQKWWSHVSSWTSCEINFCWVTSVLFKKFFRTCAQFWC